MFLSIDKQTVSYCFAKLDLETVQPFEKSCSLNCDVTRVLFTWICLEIMAGRQALIHQNPRF